LSTSREQHVKQLLSHEEMGDRKQSLFLWHLKSLAPDVPNDFLSTIWASRLPPHVQAILAGQTEGSFDSASNLADRICEVTHQPTTVSVSPAAPDNTTDLLDRLEELSHQVALLHASNSHSRSKDHHSQPRDGHCWQFRDHRHSHSRDNHSNLMLLRRPSTLAGTTRNSGTQPVIADHRAHAIRETIPPDVCTTNFGSLFVTDRTSQQRYLVYTGCDLHVCEGNAWTTTCMWSMSPSPPHTDGPPGA
jgi:hypothetical protein